jgi:hypothetical protein
LKRKKKERKKKKEKKKKNENSGVDKSVFNNDIELKLVWCINRRSE